MRLWWLALALTLAACGGENAVNPSPVLVSITQGVTTCGDVLRATAQHPYCDTSDAVCYAVATYNAEAPVENVAERGLVGSLDDVNSTDRRVGRDLNDIPNAERWQSIAVYTPDMTLTTLGDVVLSGISDDLGGLSLSTASTSAVCNDAPPVGLLAQRSGDEVAMSVNGARITVAETAFIREQDDTLLVYGITGVTVVSADGVTRIVRPGEQASVGVGASGPEAPRPAVAYAAGSLAGLPLALPPDLTQQQPSRDTSTSPGAPCTVRADWTGTYTVQRGDTLVSIAPRFDLEAATLQAGNCITNPNRLQVGAVLRVPTPATPLLPTVAGTTGVGTLVFPTMTVAPTVAPTEPFTVQESEITLGSCTTLRWSPSGAVAVELNGESVAVPGQRQVCPTVTTVYTLSVRYADGTAQTINRAVTVRRP